MGINRRRFLQAGTAAAIAASTARLGYAQEATPAADDAMATPVGTVDENGYYPSGDPAVRDAYTKMPKPFKSVEGTPANGGKITAMVMTYGAPPTPHGDNPWWQGLDERLGASWEPILVPNANYGEKATAIIASGDMPDLFYLNYNQTTSPLAKFTQQGAFTDLTQYVTGDAIKEYQNLATFPDYMWEATMMEGKIFGVPCPSGRAGQVAAYRPDWAKKLIGHTPTNSTELHDFLVKCTTDDPDGNGADDTWGMGRYDSFWDMSLIYPMFRAPNNWRVNDDGTFTKDYETDEFRMAVEFFRQLFADGGFHPDSASMQYEEAASLFKSGKTAIHADGSAIYGKGGMLESVRQFQPDAQMARLIPFGHDGGKGVTYNLPGIFGFTAIPVTVTDEDRIKELLRVMNWLSAPFGSEEWLYKERGVEGVDFEYNENGFPVSNDKFGQQSSGLVGFIGGSIQVNIDAEQPELGPLMTDEQAATYAIGINDPSTGLFSPTNIEKSAIMQQVVADGLTSIITGRAEMSEWDKVLDDWRGRGGDQVRGELEEAYAANKQG